MYHVGLPLILSTYLRVYFKWKTTISQRKQGAIVFHKYGKCMVEDTQKRKLSEVEKGRAVEDIEVRAPKP